MNIKGKGVSDIAKNAFQGRVLHCSTRFLSCYFRNYIALRMSSIAM